MTVSEAILCQFFFGSMLLISAGSADVCPPGAHFDEGLIRVDSTVNSQSASLFYDTGASATALFAAAAQRLKIPSESSKDVTVAGQNIASEISGVVDISMFGLNAKSRFLVLPLTHRCDGVLGWRSVRKPLLIDGFDRQIHLLDRLPSPEGWQRWSLDEESSQLFFTVSEDGKPVGRVFVDTGVADGLRLSPALWKDWKAQNPGSGTTLETFRYSVGEPMVSEIAWADEYRLGDLVLYDVDIGSIPTSKDGVAKDINGKEFIATIGMGALRHLRFLVSAGSGQFWTQSVSGIPQHNRLGAVFLPVSEDDPSLVCQVLPKSPAATAGLRTGDVLVQVQGPEASAMTPEDIKRTEKLFSQPAGTELELLVKRGDSTVSVRVELRDLLERRRVPAQVQAGAGQPATAPESKHGGKENAKPESEGRSQ